MCQVISWHNQPSLLQNHAIDRLIVSQIVCPTLSWAVCQSLPFFASYLFIYLIFFVQFSVLMLFFYSSCIHMYVYAEMSAT